MRSSHFCFAGGAIFGGAIATLGAEAEAGLRAAADALVAAGNYAWEQKQVIDFDSKGKIPANVPTYAEGKTEIGGYTLATIRRRRMVLRGEQTAFELESGWRHAHDLTAAEVEELRMAPSRRAQDRARNYTHVVPHEALRLLLETGTNIREDGAAIGGDIDSALIAPAALESYIAHGVKVAAPPERPHRPGMLGPANPSAPRSMDRVRATFVVWIVNGRIDEFSVEFRSQQNISFDGGPRESHDSTRVTG